MGEHFNKVIIESWSLFWDRTGLTYWMLDNKKNYDFESFLFCGLNFANIC